MKIYPHKFVMVDYYNIKCKYCNQYAENFYILPKLEEGIYYRESCISDEEKLIKDIIE